MRSAALIALVLVTGCKGQSDPEIAAAEASGKSTSVASPLPGQPGSIYPDQLPPPTVLQFEALGTEPFWSVETGPGHLRYASPEVLEGIEFEAKAVRTGKAWRYTGTLQNKPVVLTIEPGECSDGMSDTVYKLKANFTWGERADHGCARLK